MDLLDLLPFVTTKIFATHTNGQFSIGTGFFFQFVDGFNSFKSPVLITNRHVIKDAAYISINITKKNMGCPMIGQSIPIKINLSRQNVILHPDDSVDLAAILLEPYIAPYRDSLFIRYFGKPNIATDSDMKHYNILHDIIMIGYPDGIMDEVNNLPIFRKGITATNPFIDYNGMKQFLIDASCFPGSSGSPVMSYEDGMIQDADGNINIGPGIKQLKLIGIQSATFTHRADGKIVPVEIPTQIIPGTETHIPNNLGIVVKASCILDFEPLLPR